jgi:hypothetical protein
VAAYLQKPVTAEHLLRTVGRCVALAA